MSINDISEIEVFCINTHCNNSIKVKDAIKGKILGDFYCSQKCKEEDDLREKLGINKNAWWIKTS